MEEAVSYHWKDAGFPSLKAAWDRPLLLPSSSANQWDLGLCLPMVFRNT